MPVKRCASPTQRELAFGSLDNSKSTSFSFSFFNCLLILLVTIYAFTVGFNVI